MDFKKKENEEEFIKFKDNTLKDINDLLELETKTNYKRSVLITYWLNDYRKYLKQEKTFSSNYLPIYKRGSIVQVNLGFNIGNEEGGMHYAIVLNKSDNKDNPILTVIPLSSIKPNKKWYKTDVNLGTEIYMLIENKIKVLTESASETIDKVNKVFNESKSEISNETTRTLRKLIKNAEMDIDLANRCSQKIKSLKKGSYAVCNQITTVSKIRIKDPIKPDSPMYDIQISDELMNKTDKTVINTFLNL